MDFKTVMERRKKMEAGEIWADKILSVASEQGSTGSLFLGAGRDARNLGQLESHSVTHIINCADDVPNFHESNFDYLNLNIGDFGTDKGISRVFDQAAQHMKRGQNLLIHCANGSNRSATVAMAVLMIVEGVTLCVAWEKVCTRHKQSAPLTDNRLQLLLFE